jgi:hypothetical protein
MQYTTLESFATTLKPFAPLLVAIFLVILYFLPTFVAAMRGHYNTSAIFIINLFLGWSCLGWVISLAWAFTYVPPRRRRYPPNPWDD